MSVVFFIPTTYIDFVEYASLLYIPMYTFLEDGHASSDQSELRKEKARADAETRHVCLRLPCLPGRLRLVTLDVLISNIQLC